MHSSQYTQDAGYPPWMMSAYMVSKGRGLERAGIGYIELVTQQNLKYGFKVPHIYHVVIVTNQRMASTVGVDPPCESLLAHRHSPLCQR